MSYFSPSRNKHLKAFAFAPQRPGGTTLLSTLAQLHRGPARMNHLHTHIQSANTIARYSLSKTHCSDHTAVSTAVLASTRTSTTDLPLSDEIRPESRAMWGDRFTSEACTPCGSTPSQLESAQTANSWLLAVTPTARCGLQTGPGTRRSTRIPSSRFMRHFLDAAPNHVPGRNGSNSTYGTSRWGEA